MHIFLNCISTDNSKNELIHNYFRFNQIEHRVIDIFDDPSPLDLFLADKNPKLLILGFGDLGHALSYNEKIKNKLIEFINNNNYLWIWNDTDGMPKLFRYKQALQEFDRQLKSNQTKIFLEGKIINKEQHFFDNIKFEFLNFTTILNEIRVKYSSVEKFNCKKDYLATIHLKKSPLHKHRQILHQEIMSRPLLVAKGRNIFRNIKDPWIGELPTYHNWRDGNPSMDLYLDAWIELVSETFGENVYFETEKTFKPIVTKTPFIIQAAPGYLEYLKTKGFKTFNSLINENYDKEQNLEKRTKIIADLLEDIIKNSAKDFYFASKDILEYNQKRLFELLGRKQYDLDLLFHNSLLSINYKF